MLQGICQMLEELGLPQLLEEINFVHVHIRFA